MKNERMRSFFNEIMGSVNVEQIEPIQNNLEIIKSVQNN
jgi:hypothetical protein